MKRRAGWIGVSCLALVGLLAIVLVVFGLPYFAAIKECGSDDHLRKHLRVGLAVDRGGPYGPDVVFGCGWGAEGCRAILGGDRIHIRVNGKEVTVPRHYEQPVYDTVHVGTGGTRFAYFKPDELSKWLGGPGTYSITAQIGPVESKPVRIEIPSLVIESPCSIDDLRGVLGRG